VWVLGRLVDDENRCGAAGQDISGDAAEQEAGEAGAAAGTENDEVGASLLRCGDDLSCRIPVAHLGVNLASALPESRRRVRSDSLVLSLRLAELCCVTASTWPYMVGAIPVVQG
jgi:hypothetical protein